MSDESHESAFSWIRLLVTTGRVKAAGDKDEKHSKFKSQRRFARVAYCLASTSVLVMFVVVVCSFTFALVHEKSKKIMTVKQQEKYANAFYFPAALDQAKHYYSQTNAGLNLRKSFSKESEEDFKRAERYFVAQKALFEESMDGFPLHKHYSNLKLPETISFHDMIKARGELLASNYKNKKWQDFRIEKDKCAMFEFLKYNGLPHVDWIDMFQRESDFSDMMSQMRRLVRNESEFPIFIKSCHITTGAAKSVRKISDATALSDENWLEIEHWAAKMWNYRSNDWERIWAAPFNFLCSRLEPGFMVQKPWMVGRQEFPEEIKVEVIWGRAYLAFVSTGKCGGDTLILRDGSVMRYTDSLKQNILHEGKPDECYQWIVDEGHLPRVWFMAEAAARLMGIDAIRIDVFILRGNPMASVINEDSLSSGAEYRWHFPHMADLWAQGHREKRYKLVDPGIDSHKWWRGGDFYSLNVAKCNASLIATQSKTLCEKQRD
eukprot:CAMPEP_0184503846 /NCGR_PEP_ID=MMETSP0113_2-20130426/52130_1 /TAXON_ID=91329 /ORGANISM="Norrisiella sphaerica, Strain BC52" /LENGTH=490 /DNA_ID=CAMNT_0026893411 /DNA_START=117 /DNA_END=1589 /DNA_ORIENTATION=+